jgi:hypothetical protein
LNCGRIANIDAIGKAGNQDDAALRSIQKEEQRFGYHYRYRLSSVGNRHTQRQRVRERNLVLQQHPTVYRISGEDGPSGKSGSLPPSHIPPNSTFIAFIPSDDRAKWIVAE